MTEPATIVEGRLVLDDRVVAGRLTIADERIAAVDIADEAAGDGGLAAGPLIAPGFADLHVHGWGGHDAMGGSEALDGMARALLRRGVTSFLPTAVTAPLDRLDSFASDVRAWIPRAPADGAEPLGFNLEGPFLAPGRRGAHDAAHLLDPATAPAGRIDNLVDGLRLITIAPERPGAIALIERLVAAGVTVSLGHSEASVEEARRGYDAGARSTTHLFNAMSGIDHRAPGLAVAALLGDAWVELIADGVHVAPSVWPLITRLKSPDRLLVVSDAVALAGTGDGRGRLGSLEIDVRGSRATVAGTDTLAGSVIALDEAVRNLVAAGTPLPAAVAAASRAPLALLGIDDRGRIAPGQRADVVELDAELRVRRTMRRGAWISDGGGRR